MFSRSNCAQVEIHYQTIESNQLMKETSQRTGFSEGTTFERDKSSE